MLNRIRDAAQYISEYFTMLPKIGIVLGSGLNSYADLLEGIESIPYQDIRGFFGINSQRTCFPSCDGQKKRRAGVDDAREASLLRREYAAAGGFPYMGDAGVGDRDTDRHERIGRDQQQLLAPVTLSLLKIIINFPSFNPLIGRNMDKVGPRFPNMVDVYDPVLRTPPSKRPEPIAGWTSRRVFTL